MKYETPFVVSVGRASDLVAGSPMGTGDSVSGNTHQPNSAPSSSLEEK